MTPTMGKSLVNVSILLWGNHSILLWGKNFRFFLNLVVFEEYKSSEEQRDACAHRWQRIDKILGFIEVKVVDV